MARGIADLAGATETASAIRRQSESLRHPTAHAKGFAWIRRFWATVNHLRAVQVSNRILRRLPRRQRADVDTARLELPRGGWIVPPAGVPVLTSENSARIHGRDVDMSARAVWASRSHPALLRYHLHYFDELVSRGAESRLHWQQVLLHRWVEENPVGSWPGWDAYPTSLRIVNWLKWALARHTLSELAIRSLAQQLGHLERRLEFHLLGNHLFENAKALWFGGACFGGAAATRWLRTGREVLIVECEEQVLPDGGHAERSPMYHARVLEGLVDIANIERASGRPVPTPIANAINRMLRWLAVMTHPDGTYALLNDSALDQSQSYEVLARYAESVGFARPTGTGGSEYLRDSGYARLAVGRWVALLDMAPVGADHLTGHAHADTLTFELSLDGARIIVDSGTSTYERGTQRDFERSTAAHNTITINGRDSSEVWAAFRVGRRARIIASGFDQRAENVTAFAAHDGFAQQSLGAIHERQWRLQPDGLHIIDRLHGEVAVAAESRFLLHPDVAVRRIDATTFEVMRGGRPAAALRVSGSLVWRIESAAYHPRFGVSEPCMRLIGAGDLRLPAALETRISRFDI
jgi:uncharacterized heparinase superfamily protein